MIVKDVQYILYNLYTYNQTIIAYSINHTEGNYQVYLVHMTVIAGAMLV